MKPTTEDQLAELAAILAEIDLKNTVSRVIIDGLILCGKNRMVRATCARNLVLKEQ